jgi:16S rRNA G966 N2-methylase RsmD
MHYDGQRELLNPWLMQGDCLERMKEIPDGSVDMVLTDPPYGTTACKWDSIIPLEPMWEQLKRIIKPNGAIVMTASQPFTSLLVNTLADHYRHSWTWVKSRPTGFQRVSIEPLRVTEDICVFYNRTPLHLTQPTSSSITFKSWLREVIDQSGLTLKQLNYKCGFEASGYLRKSSSWANVIPSEDKLEVIKQILGTKSEPPVVTRDTRDTRVFNPQGIKSLNKVNNRASSGGNWSELKSNSYNQEFTNYPYNILYFASESGLHPTQKPVALMEYLIKTYTNEGETVLDFTMGSGTTGVACKNLNRSFIGIELDEEYFKIAQDRISAT